MNRSAAVLGLISAALLTLLGALHGASELTLARLAVVGCALGAAAVVDIREHRIPNGIVLPCAVICAALAGPATLARGLPALGLVALLLVLALLQPTALGMGDVKQALLIALSLGATAATALLFGLALAALAGLVLLLRHGRSALADALPLAPFLAAGATIALGLA
jgi:leader peptidase (prepilin peptidase)/N-methyltransferase